MRILLAGIVLLLPIAGVAQQWVYQGVLTQGLFHTNENDIYGQSAGSVSDDFTELSINGSYRSALNAHLSAQVIYRHAGAGFDDVRLDYLNLDAQLSQSDRYAAGVRLGRVKVPYGLFNESRDVAFTRPSIYLSQSIYFDLTMRETLVSADGIFPYLSVFTDRGRWELELGFGQPKSADFDTLQVLGETGAYDLEAALGYRIMFTSASESFVAALSGLYVDDVQYQTLLALEELGISSVILNGLSIDRVDIDASFEAHFNVLSLQYHWENYTALLEYGRIDVATNALDITGGTLFTSFVSRAYPELVRGINSTSESIFVQLAHRFNHRWAVSLTVDHFYSDREDRQGEVVEEAGLGRGYSRFAQAAGVGIQWAPSWQVLVQLEAHYIEGTAWLNDRENANNSGPPDRYWRAVALSFSYRF